MEDGAYKFKTNTNIIHPQIAGNLAKKFQWRKMGRDLPCSGTPSAKERYNPSRYQIPRLRASSKTGLMTIDAFAVDKLTNRLGPACGIYVAQSRVPFKYWSPKLLLEAINLHKSMSIEFWSKPRLYSNVKLQYGIDQIRTNESTSVRIEEKFVPSGEMSALPVHYSANQEW